MNRLVDIREKCVTIQKERFAVQFNRPVLYFHSFLLSTEENANYFDFVNQFLARHSRGQKDTTAPVAALCRYLQLGHYIHSRFPFS